MPSRITDYIELDDLDLDDFLDFQAINTCPVCEGYGVQDIPTWGEITCEACDGEGSFPFDKQQVSYFVELYKERKDENAEG